MTQELRIRDNRSIPGPRGDQAQDGEPPPQQNVPPGERETGEAAWELADALSSPSAPPREPEPGPQKVEETPIPFPVFPGMASEEEEAAQAPGLEIRRLARGVIRRLWLAAGIAVGIAILFLLVAVTLIESKWEASATVMVHTRQDKFSLGGAKPFESQDYNLKTMLDTIKLPSALLKVSDALGLNVAPPTLSPAIGIRTGKDSNLFQITALWTDPVVAANIANKVAGQLVQRSRDLRRNDAEDAYENYKAQLEAARRELHTVTDQMRAFKADHQVSDFNAETQVLLDSLVRLETELNTKIAETQAMREASADIDEAIKGEPEMVVTSTVYRNPLKTRLTDYEWQLQEARSRYTEQNPKVIKLQTRVDVLKQMIGETKDEGAPENLYSANTKLVDLQDRQRQLNNDIKIRDAQTAALSQTVKKNREKLAALTNAERDFQLLQQRLSSAENLESNLVGRVEEAKVVMLRNEAGFELFEAARPPADPAPSPKRLIAVAGVVLGGMTGLLVVLLLEILDPLVRTRRDALRIPGVDLAWEFQRVTDGHYAVADASVPGDPVANLFRRLINDLDARLDPADWKCLGVTSADPHVGRSLAATNLAQALAMKERQVILVDSDLRAVAGTRPTEPFELPPDQPGMLQALHSHAPVGALLSATETPGLSLLSVGGLPAEQAPQTQEVREPASADPRPVPGVQSADGNLVRLGSRQFRAVLDTLRQSDQHVVYDLPPIGAHETVAEAAASLGNVILVARSGQTSRVELREAVELLEDRGTRVRGILVTDVPADLLEGVPLFPALRPRRARWRWTRRSQSASA